MMTTVNFDPKSITNVLQDLASDEMPFINTKIGNALVDFEGNVDADTSIHGWKRN
jgi:hypothetical protein